MDYQSTRNKNIRADAATAILQGLAPDGGLYVTAELAGFDWQGVLGLGTLQMAERILSWLLPGVENMPELVKNAYAEKFETDDLTPLVPVGERYVLELFRGPTSAFKDVALSLLPQLITQARTQKGMKEDIMILTATSGDTGKAALAGFQDVPGTKIVVFYPAEGVSAVQEKQMVSQEGQNVRVCAVEGNFDDTQNGVKAIFAWGLPEHLSGKVRLSSANSINIGRLAPQVVYYFKAYSDLVRLGRIVPGDRVDFTVPTGNFGDILAGYLAKRMGLPVGKLVCASNRNNVLTDFFRTGTYDRRRPFYRTESPSMDILVSSNLERLLWLLCQNEAEVAAYQRSLTEQGFYTVSDELLQTLQAEFGWGCCDSGETASAIGTVWQEHGYLIDTHTAVAWKVASEKMGTAPMVVLSTASAYKFPAAVLSALGETAQEDEFDVMQQLCTRTGVPIPRALASLKERPVLHRDRIAREDMAAYVAEKIESWT